MIVITFSKNFLYQIVNNFMLLTIFHINLLIIFVLTIKQIKIMIQEIKNLGELIIVFTWLSDGLVYVKYFDISDIENTEEITDYDVLHQYTKDDISKEIAEFEIKHPELTLWSY